MHEILQCYSWTKKLQHGSDKFTLGACPSCLPLQCCTKSLPEFYTWMVVRICRTSLHEWSPIVRLYQCYTWCIAPSVLYTGENPEYSPPPPPPYTYATMYNVCAIHFICLFCRRPQLTRCLPSRGTWLRSIKTGSGGFWRTCPSRTL